MPNRETPATHITAVVTLLGALPRLLRGLPPDQRVAVERVIDGASRRLMRALYQLEPQRAKLVSR
jgi:hypothetical protein